MITNCFHNIRFSLSINFKRDAMDGYDQHLRLPLRIFSDPIMTQLMLQDSENMSFGMLEKARQNAQLWGHPNYHELLFPQLYQRSPNAGAPSNLAAWQNQWTQSQLNAATAAAAAAAVNIRKSPEDHHFDQQHQQQQHFNLERRSHLPVRFNPYQIFSSSSSPSPYVEPSGQSNSDEQLRDSPTTNWFLLRKYICTFTSIIMWKNYI